MKTISFLVEVSVLQTIFILLYKIVLAKETFFEKNRYFLLFSMLLAWLLPLLHFDFISNSLPTSIIQLPEFSTDGINEKLAKSWNFSFDTSLALIYTLGFLFFILRMIFHLQQAIYFKHKGKILAKNNYNLIEVPFEISAFSFWNNVFISEKTNVEIKEEIIRHELIHIQQKHSLDLLITEINIALLWFNPIIVLFRNELKMVHEFIADDYSIKKSEHKKKYLQALLAENLKVAPQLLINRFSNQNHLLKRIKMMNQQKSINQKTWKYFLILPIVAIALYFNACKEKNDTTLHNDNKLITDETVYTEVDVMPEYKGGQEALFSYLGSNIHYPESDKNAKLEGTVYIQFVINENGKVTQTKVLKGVSEAMDKEALRVIENMPDWNAGKKNGKKVKVQYNIPIRFKL